MKNDTYFKKVIGQNRRKLIKEHGYPPSTVHSWEHGLRFPSYVKAQELASRLGIELNSIPYLKRNI